MSTSQTIPAADPWVIARAEQIVSLRRRYNSSGQDGEDMHNIVAALVVQIPASGRQQELFAV